MKKNILVLGYFGYHNNQLDGQTVKTRDLFRLIKEQSLGCSVKKFDTQDFKYDKSSIMKMLIEICKCKILIYLPAHNNLKYIFPFIFVLSKILNIQIHYFVIGGWLKEYLMNLPIHRWMLAKIKGIYVETQLMKKSLIHTYGLNNVKLFPNFRFFDFTPKPRNESTKLNLVFMARINKMKGLDWIFHFCEYIQTNNLSDHYSISFYGPLIKEDKAYFLENINKYDFVKYKGELQPEDIHMTLSVYDVMLLPTHYYTEGLPGSVVDAYISGLPVIVTKWKHSTEFVEDGKTGYIIPFEKGEDRLIKTIVEIENNRDILRKMRVEIINYRNRFAPPNINDYINNK